MMRRVTLKDVAEHAGVSTATVSFVLNDKPRVAEATRRKVRQSLSELDYGYIRSLRAQESRVVGLVVTCPRDPYFAEFATGIQQALLAHGRMVLLGVSDEDVAQQTAVLRAMIEHQVGGILLIPSNGTRVEDLSLLAGRPHILLARRVRGLDADYVGADNTAGARAAALHLVEHGCRTVGFVGGFDGSSTRIERLRGVDVALAEVGQRRAATHAPTCPPDRDSARQSAAGLLTGDPSTERVDGVVCFNDTVAFGVLDAVENAGLRAGIDVRVIGFDDVYGAAFHRPALSSVALAAVHGGARAAELMIKRIEGLDSPAETVEIPAKLEVRESCGCSIKRP